MIQLQIYPIKFCDEQFVIKSSDDGVGAGISLAVDLEPGKVIMQRKLAADSFLSVSWTKLANSESERYSNARAVPKAVLTQVFHVNGLLFYMRDAGDREPFLWNSQTNRPPRNDHCACCEENSEPEDVIGEDIESEGENSDLFSGDEECVGELELELAIDTFNIGATNDVSGGEVGLEAAGSLGKVDALEKLTEEPTHPTSSAVDQELEKLV
ncbi:hypothetical protein F0562_018315 [Nyssa sinensis]|uniref:Uncharacterized protein n=1 Tax=Nyssa sinensis TaxID=561372 RepID=A0A5J4ZBR5_9ASTE|nr:hypothetical protein F0562_018315 [Nyssa sinensis]